MSTSVVAALELVSAAGILAFWILFFTRRFHRPAEAAQTLAIVAWVSAAGLVLVWHLA